VKNVTGYEETRRRAELSKGPRIVVIGGGTGLSTALRGIKKYTSNITAIVTVADDGGGSGVLRRDLGILPPGDIRNCILALAETEPIMQKLLQYRFTEGMLKGQSFGNLFLAAMIGITSGFEEAVRKMSDVLAVTGRVLPVTLDNVNLCAELEDGRRVHGESNIPVFNIRNNGRIKCVYLEPGYSKPLPGAVEAIMEADAIVMGPGSLYTSIIPNLLVNGITNYIEKSSAIKIYVCNVMTQPGETDGYTLSRHIDALERHSYKGIVEYCVASTTPIKGKLRQKYQEDGAEPVVIDEENIAGRGFVLKTGDYTNVEDEYIRHDPNKLAHAIMEIIHEHLS